MVRVDEVVCETSEPGTEVHIVMDNDATRKTPPVKRWFARRPWCHAHVTPTGQAGGNQVERFFDEITTRRIRRGVFRSVRSLENAIRESTDARDQNARPFNRTADADNIVRRVKNICIDTSNSGHSARRMVSELDLVDLATGLDPAGLAPLHELHRINPPAAVLDFGDIGVRLA